jgi:hypothetical protein
MNGQITLNDIPWGCTHVQLANPLDYCQRPTFMKWDKWYYSENKPGVVNCWYIWHQRKFHRDLGYQRPKDESLFLTVEEYRKTLQN